MCVCVPLLRLCRDMTDVTLAECASCLNMRASFYRLVWFLFKEERLSALTRAEMSGRHLNTPPNSIKWKRFKCSCWCSWKDLIFSYIIELFFLLLKCHILAKSHSINVTMWRLSAAGQTELLFKNLTHIWVLTNGGAATVLLIFLDTKDYINALAHTQTRTRVVLLLSSNCSVFF